MVSSDIVDHQINTAKKLIRAAITLSFVGFVLYALAYLTNNTLFVYDQHTPMVDVFLFVASSMIVLMIFSRFSGYLDYESAMSLNFFLFFMLVPTLISAFCVCVSEIDDSEYVYLESRIVSSGENGKMIAMGVLKQREKVNGWQYRTIINDLNGIEAEESKADDSRRKIQEHENAKSSLFKAIYND